MTFEGCSNTQFVDLSNPVIKVPTWKVIGEPRSIPSPPEPIVPLISFNNLAEIMQHPQLNIIPVADSLAVGWLEENTRIDYPYVQSGKSISGNSKTNIAGQEVIQKIIAENHVETNPFVLIALGTNDLFYWWTRDADTVKARFELAVAKLTEHQIPVMLLTVPPVNGSYEGCSADLINERIDQLNKVIFSLSGNPLVEVIDVHRVLDQQRQNPENKLYDSDHLHLLPAGYDLISSAVVTHFNQSELVKSRRMPESLVGTHN